MNLSDRVRANVLRLLEAKGMTYSDLGWDRRYVGHMLNDKGHNRKGFSLARVQEFADRLHVDPMELVRLPREGE